MKMNTPALRSLLDALGTVSTGLSDIIRHPIKEVYDSDSVWFMPLALGRGIGTGTYSFIRNLAYGAGQLVTGVVDDLGHRIDAFTLMESDKLPELRQQALLFLHGNPSEWLKPVDELEDEVRRVEEMAEEEVEVASAGTGAGGEEEAPCHRSSSLYRGSRYFQAEVERSVSGLWKGPESGLRRSGAVGAVSGAVQGLSGVVLRPPLAVLRILSSPIASFLDAGMTEEVGESSEEVE